MRIIAGSLGGRQFNSPHGHRTHPMSDKARGAIFNTLGDISGLIILDAFAGSGALSFEAISRGAEQVIAIDSDKAAQQAIQASITELGLTQVKLIKATIKAWLSTTNQQFDIVLADPPYEDLQVPSLVRLADRAKSQGLVIFSLPPKTDFQLSPNFELLATKDYGDARLVFYRRA